MRPNSPSVVQLLNKGLRASIDSDITPLIRSIEVSLKYSAQNKKNSQVQLLALILSALHTWRLKYFFDALKNVTTMLVLQFSDRTFYNLYAKSKSLNLASDPLQLIELNNKCR